MGVIIMRITDLQKKALVEAAHTCFGESAQIWLFGSRVLDESSGGDIDLYIETDLPELIVRAKLNFRKQIRPVFGDQKIDLIVHRCHLEIQAIHEIAKETGVELL